jgi:hypothetical protein
MLNPETLIIKRRSGIHQRKIKSGIVNGAHQSDDGLIYTGGGSTILELELVFDISIKGSTVQSSDVRDLTKPIWDLSENSIMSNGEYRPGGCRFVWGKSWNLPCVISSISEHFDLFDSSGVPKRSWLKLRLLRTNQLKNSNARYAFDEKTPSYSMQEADSLIADNYSASDLSLNAMIEDLNPYRV